MVRSGYEAVTCFAEALPPLQAVWPGMWPTDLLLQVHLLPSSLVAYQLPSRTEMELFLLC